MKKFTTLCASLLLVACGSPTSIQTGEVGRVLGSRGLEDKVIQPGTFRLDWCGGPGMTCPKLVRLQTTVTTHETTIDHVFLPKSNINLSNVKVALQFRIKSDKQAISTVYEQVRPQAASINDDETSRVLLITADDVWSTYGARIAPNAVITVLREHTVDEVLAHVPEISDNVRIAVNHLLKDSPVEVTEVGFPNGIGEIPAQVIDKMHQNFAVAADRDRRIKMLEADLAVETQRRAVMLVRTDNDIHNAEKAGVSYIEYVQLRALDGFADAAIAGTSVALGTGAVNVARSK